MANTSRRPRPASAWPRIFDRRRMTGRVLEVLRAQTVAGAVLLTGTLAAAVSCAHKPASSEQEQVAHDSASSLVFRFEPPALPPSSPCLPAVSASPDKSATLLMAIDPEPGGRSFYKRELYTRIEISLFRSLTRELEHRFWYRSREDRANAPPLQSCAIVRLRI